MSSVFYLIITLLVLLVGHVFVNTTLSRSLDSRSNNTNNNLNNKENSWKSSFLTSLSQLRICLIESANTTNIFCLIVIGSFTGIFWGWSPALLAIILCHLVIVNSLSVMANYKMSKNAHSLAKDFYRSPHRDFASLSTKKNRQLYAWIIMYSFGVLCSAILVYLAANILGMESGSLILIIGIGIAAYASLAAEKPLIGMIVALAIVIASLPLSSKMGIYIIGSWQPISGFKALTINDHWIFAGIVISATYVIRGQLLKANALLSTSSMMTIWYERLCTISKFSNLSIISAILIFYVVKQPVIDAPMHALSDSLPTYIKIIAIVLFFSVGNFIDLLNGLFNSNSQINTVSKRFQSNNSLSSYALISAFCAIVLVFLFSSSVGLGAWQTHFLVWSPDKPLIDNFSKAIGSIADALTFYGLNEATAKSLVASLLLLNISTLLIKLMRLNEHCLGVLHHVTNTEFKVRTNNCIALSVLVIAFFLSGVSTNTWLLLGIVSLCGTLIVAIDLMETFLNEGESHPFIWLGLTLLCGIVLLAIPQIIAWYNSALILAITSSITVVVTLFVISEKAVSIFSQFRKLSSPQEINLNDND